MATNVAAVVATIEYISRGAQAAIKDAEQVERAQGKLAPQAQQVTAALRQESAELELLTKRLAAAGTAVVTNFGSMETAQKLAAGLTDRMRMLGTAVQQALASGDVAGAANIVIGAVTQAGTAADTSVQKLAAMAQTLDPLRQRSEALAQEVANLTAWFKQLGIAPEDVRQRAAALRGEIEQLTAQIEQSSRAKFGAVDPQAMLDLVTVIEQVKTSLASADQLGTPLAVTMQNLADRLGITRQEAEGLVAKVRELGVLETAEKNTERLAKAQLDATRAAQQHANSLGQVADQAKKVASRPDLVDPQGAKAVAGLREYTSASDAVSRKAGMVERATQRLNQTLRGTATAGRHARSGLRFTQEEMGRLMMYLGRGRGSIGAFHSFFGRLVGVAQRFGLALLRTNPLLLVGIGSIAAMGIKAAIATVNVAKLAEAFVLLNRQLHVAQGTTATTVWADQADQAGILATELEKAGLGVANYFRYLGAGDAISRRAAETTRQMTVVLSRLGVEAPRVGQIVEQVLRGQDLALQDIGLPRMPQEEIVARALATTGKVAPQMLSDVDKANAALDLLRERVEAIGEKAEGPRSVGEALRSIKVAAKNAYTEMARSERVQQAWGQIAAAIDSLRPFLESAARKFAQIAGDIVEWFGRNAKGIRNFLLDVGEAVDTIMMLFKAALRAVQWVGAQLLGIWADLIRSLNQAGLGFLTGVDESDIANWERLSQEWSDAAGQALALAPALERARSAVRAVTKESELNATSVEKAFAALKRLGGMHSVNAETMAEVVRYLALSDREYLDLLGTLTRVNGVVGNQRIEMSYLRGEIDRVATKLRDAEQASFDYAQSIRDAFEAERATASAATGLVGAFERFIQARDTAREEGTASAVFNVLEAEIALQDKLVREGVGALNTAAEYFRAQLEAGVISRAGYDAAIRGLGEVRRYAAGVAPEVKKAQDAFQGTGEQARAAATGGMSTFNTATGQASTLVGGLSSNLQTLQSDIINTARVAASNPILIQGSVNWSSGGGVGIGAVPDQGSWWSNALGAAWRAITGGNASATMLGGTRPTTPPPTGPPGPGFGSKPVNVVSLDEARRKAARGRDAGLADTAATQAATAYSLRGPQFPPGGPTGDSVFSRQGGGGGGGQSLEATIEQIRRLIEEVNRAISIASRGGVRVGTGGNVIPFEPGSFVDTRGGEISIGTILIRGVWDFADPAAKRQIIRELEEALKNLRAEAS